MTFQSVWFLSAYQSLRRMFLLVLAFAALGFWGATLAQTADGQPVTPPLAASPSPDVANLLSTYRVAAGDVITIRVYGEDDLSREKVRISDAGTFPYPFLGEVKALGLTSGEIERAVFTGLNGRYLVNPRVSVSIEVYRPFFINGMIASPGAYPYLPGLTVLKASSLAGGFKERASLSKIFIIRESDPKGTPQKVELNSPVNPGDTIFIEESFF